MHFSLVFSKLHPELYVLPFVAVASAARTTTRSHLTNRHGPRKFQHTVRTETHCHLDTDTTLYTHNQCSNNDRDGTCPNNSLWPHHMPRGLAPVQFAADVQGLSWDSVQSGGRRAVAARRAETASRRRLDSSLDRRSY